jgi:alkaline phosphatase D
VVVNFPHNPTGAAPTREDFARLVAAVGDSGAYLFSDEMYRWLEREPGDRLPSAVELSRRAVVLGGLSKSLSAPGLVEAFEHRFPKDHPLRALYLADIAGKPQPAVNLLLHHGVRACLEYQRSGDAERARRLSNPDLAPHLSFVDMGGHGYATLRVAGDAVDCEFVCIPRPLERSPSPDGGPLRYRVNHRVPLWRRGERPRLARDVIEGEPGLAL